ncbi:MAG: hypothetical protein ABDI19_00625 [Armatimonadota bacterium]
MRPKVQAHKAWVALVWLLVLLTGNLLHPLTHEPSSASSDCLVCTLQRLPAVPESLDEAVRQAIEPAWVPVRWTPAEPSSKYRSLYASSLIPRAPPV